jgi:hypothetical protein
MVQSLRRELPLCPVPRPFLAIPPVVNLVCLLCVGRFDNSDPDVELTSAARTTNLLREANQARRRACQTALNAGHGGERQSRRPPKIGVLVC